jgi:protein-S-isoprenylcysteine O-methyltransferase Ste14
MTSAALLRILAYVWTAFGAYWIGTGFLKKSSGAPGGKSRRLALALLAAAFLVLFLERRRISPALILVLGSAWAGAGLYWAAPGKGAQSGEFRWYRPMRLLVLAAVFALLFWNATGIGFLGWSIVGHAAPLLGWTGFALTIAGLACALWARVVLGKYWSDKVILQTEHQLIRTGPYARMRHPIYSGVLLAVLGTALVVGEWRGLLAFLLLLVNYSIKAKREEKILAERFGGEFREHASHTGFLFPRIQRSTF